MRFAECKQFYRGCGRFVLRAVISEVTLGMVRNFALGRLYRNRSRRVDLPSDHGLTTSASMFATTFLE